MVCFQNTIDQQSFTVTTDAFETFKQKSNELMSTQQRTMFTFAPSIEGSIDSLIGLLMKILIFTQLPARIEYAF